MIRVVAELYDVIEDLFMLRASGEKSKEISIYMNAEFYEKCKKKQEQAEKPVVVEFLEKDTLFGYPVYRVISESHPPYEIFTK